MSSPAVSNKKKIPPSLIFRFMLGQWVRNKYVHAFVSEPWAETCSFIGESITVHNGPCSSPCCPFLHEDSEPQALMDPIYTAQMKRAHGRDAIPPKAIKGIL